jgi:exodeoxyribonuclease X
MIIRIVDLETCGLPPDNVQIVEIATVDLVQGEDGKWSRGRMWSTLINPGRSIPPEISAVHHITDDMVAGAPAMTDAAIQEKLCLIDEMLTSPDYFAAHNAKFEIAAIGAARSVPLPAPFICTYKCAVTCWPESPGFKNQTLRYWLKLQLADPSLAFPHRALGDAYVTAAILRRMLSIFDWTPAQMASISAAPIILPKLHFGKHEGVPCKDVPADYWEWVLKNIKDDEDVLHTAQAYLQRRRAAARARSPV